MIAVDLFAGAGGFSEGAKRAGVRVVYAANHWPLAIHYHWENHPNTHHQCQDLQQADWRQVPSHDIQLAAPACQGHSKARGKERPHHDALRSTAWAVVACAEYHRSPFVVVENVTDFLDWNLYPAWKMAMETIGYSVSPHIIDAADFGVPQHRVRVFIVCALSRAPLVLKLPKMTHRPINDVIEWNEHEWNAIDRPGRSLATLERVKAGRARFGERFVMPYYKSGSGTTGRSIHRPLGTITTKARWAVVDGDRMRMLQPSEAKAAMGFPRSYALPNTKHEAMHLLGNAVCPLVGEGLLSELKRAA